MLARFAFFLSFALPATSFAQTPDGTDINKAIPIYFGQIVTDFVDVSVGPAALVYSIVLAKGQKISVTGSISPARRYGVCLLAPATITIKPEPACLASSGTSIPIVGTSFTYEVATAGTYYLRIGTLDPSGKFELQIRAQGTPIVVPNPPTAGCLSGPINYITYSLQLIAAGLPDEVSIGGAKACASCTVKAPAYPEIANRLEYALKARVNVEACYDASGNIFQIKLVQP